MGHDDIPSADRAEDAYDAAERARMMLRNGVQSAGELHLLDALDHIARALESLGYTVTVTVEGPDT